MDVTHQLEQYPITIVTQPQFFMGYVKGFRQPCVLLQIKIAPFALTQMTHLQQAFHYYFPSYSLNLGIEPTAKEFGFCFGEFIRMLQVKALHPIFEEIRIERSDHQAFKLCIPMLNEICLQQTLAFAFNFVNRHALSTFFKPNEVVTKQRDALLGFLSACAPHGSNSFRFLHAAHHADIPWVFIGVNAFQFGYGYHSKWLDSSITDNTSYIAVKMTKDKWHGSSFLQRLGFPTTEKYLVRTEEEALQTAGKIGYPVVIKPDNQDGGDGVTAHIHSDQRLRKAFRLAHQYSKNLLLEKHVIGKDYRLVVLNGKLIWAIERIPAGVFGDGISTIEILVKLVNQNPSRTRELFPVKKIEFNEEAMDLLQENGWKPNSIPEMGHFIPLSRIANISRGGTAVAVFDKVHPDNQTLVETVAKVCRLDLAGIDLILPDIEVSYRETGGKIIEVNSQPQLGISTAPHIYDQILTRLVINKGRIPIIVVLGHYANEAFEQHLHDFYFSEKKKIAVVKNKKAFINSQKIIEGHSQYEVGRALLSLEEVEAMIFCIDDFSDLANGLPFDCCDLLFCFAPPLNTKPTPFNEQDFIETLFKGCRGQILIIEQVINYLKPFTSVIPNKTILVLDNQVPEGKQFPEFIQRIAYYDENLLLPSNLEHLSLLNKSLLQCCQVVCKNE